MIPYISKNAEWVDFFESLCSSFFSNFLRIASTIETAQIDIPNTIQRCNEKGRIMLVYWAFFRGVVQYKLIKWSK